jgi:hypothetical protein
MEYERIPKAVLMEKGFDFNHYTREMEVHGRGYKACYDIAYQIVQEDKGIYVYIEQTNGNQAS